MFCFFMCVLISDVFTIFTVYPPFAIACFSSDSNFHLLRQLLPSSLTAAGRYILKLQIDLKSFFGLGDFPDFDSELI